MANNFRSTKRILSISSEETAVFSQICDTYELLEMILFELRTKDLLFAQGVCKQWKQLIDSSSKLQQALFFKPIPGDPLLWGSPRLRTPGGGKVKSPVVLKNPLLDIAFQLLSEFSFEGRPTKPLGKVVCRYNYSNAWSLNPTWLCKDASWRRMLPCQPSIHSCLFVNIETFWDIDTTGLLIKDGIFTMEHVLEHLDSVMHRISGRRRMRIAQEPALSAARYLKTNHDLERLIVWLRSTPPSELDMKRRTPKNRLQVNLQEYCDYYYGGDRAES